MSIRAGVQFDLNDPVFQIFVQKQSWRDAMIRACKEVCDPSTAVARSVVKIIKLIPAIEHVGNFMENFLSLFEKHGVRPQESVEIYNQDIWNDFYDGLPKDNENSPSLSHKNYNESHSEFQNLLSQKATEGQHLRNTVNSGVKEYLSKKAFVGLNPNITKKNPQMSFKNQQLLSKNRSSNNAA